VSIIGTHLAGSLAGTSAAERAQHAERKREEERRAQASRGRDEYVVTPVESAEAPRSAKGNDQEEAHEDRESKAGYHAAGGAAGYTNRGERRVAGRPSLDVSG